MARKYTQKYLVLKSTFSLLYAQTLDPKGKMHAAGPLSYLNAKLLVLFTFLHFLRPIITMNDQPCLEVLLSKYLAWVLIQTGHLIGLGS